MPAPKQLRLRPGIPMDQDTRLDTRRPRADPQLARATAEDAVVPVSKGFVQRLFGRSSLPIAKAPRQGWMVLPVRVPVTRWSPYLVSFIGLVAVPSFVAILYLAFIASDQYVSEARFALHAAQNDLNTSKQSSSSMSSTSAGSLPALTSQEAYIVTGYIHSHAILDDLSKEVDVRDIFRRPEADFWAALKANASAEDLLKYWNGMVTTSIDGPSGIVTVYARAFRPDDALRLTQAIVRASEKLVNEISERARNDTMKRSEEEVRRTEGLVRQALADMRAYRDKEGFISPVTAATSTSKLLLDAMADKIKLENDYFATSASLSPNAPSLQTLKARLQGLDKQIDDLKSQLTTSSPQGKAISASLGRFEELELQRVFAEKLYTMAQDALERARLKAERQNIYLATFVPPALPEEAKYPERLALSCLMPIGLLILWGIFALIGAAINDHRY
jgi:capsular polysaccharide transport system permease protein